MQHYLTAKFRLKHSLLTASQKLVLLALENNARPIQLAKIIMGDDPCPSLLGRIVLVSYDLRNVEVKHFSSGLIEVSFGMESEHAQTGVFDSCLEKILTSIIGDAAVKTEDESIAILVRSKDEDRRVFRYTSPVKRSPVLDFPARIDYSALKALAINE